jgi:phage shock protein C
MFCRHCGTEMEEHFRFCSRCGAATANAPESAWVPRLSRPREGHRIAGVCAGVARYLDVDVTLVRVVWLLITVFPPLPGILIYVVCWVVMPKDPLPPLEAREQAPTPG